MSERRLSQALLRPSGATAPKHYILPDYEIAFLEQLVVDEAGIEETAKLLRATPEALRCALAKEPFSLREMPLGPTFLVPQEILDAAHGWWRDTHISRNMLCAIMGRVGDRPMKYPKGCDIGVSACLYELVHPFPLTTIQTVLLAVCGRCDWRNAPMVEDFTPELWLELLRAHEKVNRTNLRRGVKRVARARATRSVMARRFEIERSARAREERVVAAFFAAMEAKLEEKGELEEKKEEGPTTDEYPPTVGRYSKGTNRQRYAVAAGAAS